jgi:hypothetical protein
VDRRFSRLATEAFRPKFGLNRLVQISSFSIAVSRAAGVRERDGGVRSRAREDGSDAIKRDGPRTRTREKSGGGIRFRQFSMRITAADVVYIALDHSPRRSPAKLRFGARLERSLGLFPSLWLSWPPAMIQWERRFSCDVHLRRSTVISWDVSAEDLTRTRIGYLMFKINSPEISTF